MKIEVCMGSSCHAKGASRVLDLLKEVAKDRLVIMVTHNPELAKEYSTRIVKLKDGKTYEYIWQEIFTGNGKVSYMDREGKLQENNKQVQVKNTKTTFFTV